MWNRLLLCVFAALPTQAFALIAIHGGAVAELGTRPQLAAVVKLEIAKSLIDASICTGTFISDRHVLTAAHCLEGGERAYVSVPRPEGGFWELGDTSELFVSDDVADVAVVRFAPGTFGGRPLDFRFFHDGLAGAGLRFRTFGYGRTEGGPGDDALRSSWIPSLEISPAIFTSRDSFRVDQGDSGGPLFAVGAGRSFVVGVNHAYDSETASIQYFRPIPAAFFERLLEEGLDLPAVRCRCADQATFTRSRDDDGRLIGRWVDTAREESLRPYGYETPCARHASPPSDETYAGEDLADGTPTSIHRTSTGMRCRAEGPAIRFAQPLRGTAP